MWPPQPDSFKRMLGGRAIRHGASHSVKANRYPGDDVELGVGLFNVA